MRPTDKQACERAFGTIQSLLFEQLPGFRGVDVADRGADPEGDAVLTLAEIENLVATWIVQVWQNPKFGEYGPCWDPGDDHSPNTLFAAAMAQGGFSLEIPRPELYYELLPAHHVKIHNARGLLVRFPRATRPGIAWTSGKGSPNRTTPSCWTSRTSSSAARSWSSGRLGQPERPRQHPGDGLVAARDWMTVYRLPPYARELNPVEMVWSPR